MKTKLTYILACFAAIWLLASCNSRNALMKRHYMKGYYFERGTAKHTMPLPRNVDKAPVSVKHKRVVTATSEPLAAADVAEATPTGQASTAVKSVKKPFRMRKHPPIYTLVPVIPGIKAAESQQPLMPVVRDDDGLSLFWAVILVVVILWAIGFLTGGFGLGNLIHLLLVVALILLILWLLRII